MPSIPRSWTRARLCLAGMAAVVTTCLPMSLFRLEGAQHGAPAARGKTAVPSKRTVGVRKVKVADIRHVRVFYNETMYAGHTNRGGIWNFGDGEIAVAHLVKKVNYATGANVASPFHHDYSRAEGSGVMINRSFDNGATWPDSEKKWIWNNDRPVELILEWLRPVDTKEREQIDLSDPNAIIHFSPSEYLKYPLGGGDIRGRPNANFYVGKRPDKLYGPVFSLRSRDRGRTWESHATLIEGEPAEGGLIAANLGHVRFDNGVLGIVGSTVRNGRHTACFYASYDNGLTWQFVSEVARATNDNDLSQRYTYLGVHRLPDGRLLCSMYRLPNSYIYVSTSRDDGMTWTEPRAIVSPGTYSLPLTGAEPERAIGDSDAPSRRYRSPYTLVLKSGRILTIFARREYPARGGRGILGVLSDDLGETWSEEFVIRGDAYTWDCGYPVATELSDGRIFTAYYITSKGDKPVPLHSAVRYIAGTHFRLEP